MLLRTEFFSALALLIGIVLIVQGCATTSPTPGAIDAQPRGTVSFAQQIAPIFEARCTQCHGEPVAESGLNLSTYEGAMVGSEYGTVVEAGNPDESLIIDMISSGGMPAEGDPMPSEELELLRSWIAEGAENN
jgi:mono/diheme cytochrome c family protein